MDEVSLKLTTAEYQLLLKHVYIANWILTATKETRDKTIEDFNQKILKFIKTNQIEERIDKDKKQNMYFVNDDLENLYLEEIEEYNEDIFVEELIDQLTKKELVKTYSEEELSGMNEIKFNKVFDAIQEKYTAEIEANGMRNIEAVVQKSQ